MAASHIFFGMLIRVNKLMPKRACCPSQCGRMTNDKPKSK